MSDHPLSPSGVGTQTKYVMEALLKTGKYRIISLGGAIKHNSYDPIKIEPYGEDWIVQPIDGYGTPEIIRSILRTERPDLVWFMTDPRFYGWLWEMEDEIRAICPMMYYHVWDNYPYPDFNGQWYDSTDVIASISKVTHDIVQTVSPNVEAHYVPHAVNSDYFTPRPPEQVEKFAKDILSANDNWKSKTTFFWNNRNARRKQSGSLIFWFKDFLDEVGHDAARLIMHTDSKDPNGQDLVAILNNLGLTNGEVYLSQEKVSPETLAMYYNMADCTVNIADAEGFGLATLESLSSGTPIIVTMTGGLQEQVTDGENWFGIGLEPASKAIIGSQQVPYIYEDRVSREDVIAALKKMHEMDPEERIKLGLSGRLHVQNNYGFEKFCNTWIELVDQTMEKYGSWETRKNYNRWHFKEIV
jgi:glycosyltransferase involved in cell wall biosynthesis